MVINWRLRREFVNLYIDAEKQRYRVWGYRGGAYVYDTQKGYKCICEFDPRKGCQSRGEFVEAWGPPHKTWEPWKPWNNKKKARFELVESKPAYYTLMCVRCPERYQYFGDINGPKQIIARVRRKRNGPGYRPIRLCEEHARELGLVW